MNAEITDLLDRHQWSESIIKLTAYVVSLCRFKKITLPKSLEPEDLVMEAIEKVYTGERKWDYQAEPDLHKYLMSVVKSILSNTLNESASKLTDNFNEYELDLFATDNHQESAVYSKQLDSAIILELKGEPELCLVYKCLKDGYTPKEIAEEYGIDIDDIRNIRRKVSRRVYKVINNLEKNILE